MQLYRYTLNFVQILIVLTFTLSSCVVDMFDAKLKIINNSNETVFVDILKNENSPLQNPVKIDMKTHDTLWQFMRWIPALDSISNTPPSGSWDGFINNECQDSVLTVVFYSESKIKAFKNDSANTNIIYSKKYKFRIEDLEKCHWRILYK